MEFREKNIAMIQSKHCDELIELNHCDGSNRLSQ